MARKFLYFIAAAVFLVLLVLLAFRLFPQQISRFAFVPGTEFVKPPPLPANAYAGTARWVAHPQLKNDPSRWRPDGIQPATATRSGAAIFFIHPTSLLSRSHWNAALDDATTNNRTDNYVRLMTSALADSGTIWAPRYRQATLGAFLTDQPAGQAALAAAYGDVLAAFDHFLAAQPAGAPIILAGHSQGSMHLSRLLKDRVAGQPLAKRVVAAYIIGWPVPVAADLPAMGLPPCTAAAQTGCILSYQSFAEPAGYAGTMDLFEAIPGLTGKSRRDDTYLCTNPLTGGAAPTSGADQNSGMLKPSANFADGALVRSGVPARCDAKGFLLIGSGPDLGPFVMPGNNYHAYDYPLFWMNVRADVERRLRAFAGGDGK